MNTLCLPAGGSGVVCRLSVSSVGDPFLRFPAPGPFFFTLVGLFLDGATVGCNASQQNIGFERSQTEFEGACSEISIHVILVTSNERIKFFLLKPSLR